MPRATPVPRPSAGSALTIRRRSRPIALRSWLMGSMPPPPRSSDAHQALSDISKRTIEQFKAENLHLTSHASSTSTAQENLLLVDLNQRVEEIQKLIISQQKMYQGVIHDMQQQHQQQLRVVQEQICQLEQRVFGMSTGASATGVFAGAAEDAAGVFTEAAEGVVAAAATSSSSPSSYLSFSSSSSFMSPSSHRSPGLL